MQDGMILFQPHENAFGTITSRYVIADSTGIEIVGQFSVDVLPVNDDPVAIDDRLLGVEDRAITVPLSYFLTNDADADGHGLVLTSVQDAYGGTVALDGQDNVVFTPEADLNKDNGVAGFTYTLTDSSGASTTGQVRVVLDPANDAPVIDRLPTVTGQEDVRLVAALPADAFSDIDGDTLEISVTLAGGGGLPDWLSFDPGTMALLGTPPADFNGSFTLRASAFDGTATVTRDFTLTFDPVNDAPVLSGTFSDRFVAEDTVIDITLQQGLFSDPDGDALSYSLTMADGSALPAWLAFEPSTLRVTGTPPENMTGSLDLRLTASDGAETISDVFRLTLTNVNDAPVIVTPFDDRNVSPETDFSFDVPADGFADPDGQDLALAMRQKGGSALPSWMSFDGSTLSGRAPSSAMGVYVLELMASDGTLTTSDEFVFVVSGARAGNTAPVAVDDTGLTVRAGQVQLIDPADLLENDSDPEGDTLAVVQVGGATKGTVTLTAEGITYTPNSGASGIDSFTYTVTDGALTDEATVNLTILEQSGSGTAEDPTTLRPSLGEDEIAFTGGVEVLSGTPEALDGDTLENIGFGDGLRLEGTHLSESDFSYDPQTGVLTFGTHSLTVEDPAQPLGEFLIIRRQDDTGATYTEALFTRGTGQLAEGAGVDPALVNGLTPKAYLSGENGQGFGVTLTQSGALYDNALGYFKTNTASGAIDEVGLLFANAGAQSVGDSAGISGLTTDQTLEFFMVADGAALLDGFNGQLGLTANGAGILQLTMDGALMDQATVYSSLGASFNPDGQEHFLSGAYSGGYGLQVGIEDLFGGGDRDFQDITFQVAVVDDTIL
jgi:hypothetical protein